MDAASINLPMVIQQAGAVSQVQEGVSRQALAQQAAAQQEVARQQEMERSTVPRAQRADTENRVQTGDQGGGQGQTQQRQPGQRRPQEASPLPLDPEAGGLVDVVV